MDEHLGLQGSSLWENLQLRVRRPYSDYEDEFQQIQESWPYLVRIGQSASSPGVASGDLLSQSTTSAHEWFESIPVYQLQQQQEQAIHHSPEVICTFCRVTFGYCQDGIECLGAWALSTENANGNSPQESDFHVDGVDPGQNVGMNNPAPLLSDNQMQVPFQLTLTQNQLYLSPEQDASGLWIDSSNSFAMSDVVDPLFESNDTFLSSSPPELENDLSLSGILQGSANLFQLVPFAESEPARSGMDLSPANGSRPQEKARSSYTTSEWIVLTADSYQSSQVRSTRIRRAEQRENRRKVRASGGACSACRKSKRRCSPRHYRRVSTAYRSSRSNDDQSQGSTSPFLITQDWQT